MINDDKLEELSYKLDDILLALCIEYEISPLLLSSVVLARMMLMADNTNSGKDFRSLLDSCSEKPINNVFKQTQVH